MSVDQTNSGISSSGDKKISDIKPASVILIAEEIPERVQNAARNHKIIGRISEKGKETNTDRSTARESTKNSEVREKNTHGNEQNDRKITVHTEYGDIRLRTPSNMRNERIEQGRQVEVDIPKDSSKDIVYVRYINRQENITKGEEVHKVGRNIHTPLNIEISASDKMKLPSFSSSSDVIRASLISAVNIKPIDIDYGQILPEKHSVQIFQNNLITSIENAGFQNNEYMLIENIVFNSQFFSFTSEVSSKLFAEVQLSDIHKKSFIESIGQKLNPSRGIYGLTMIVSDNLTAKLAGSVFPKTHDISVGQLSVSKSDLLSEGNEFNAKNYFSAVEISNTKSLPVMLNISSETQKNPTLFEGGKNTDLILAEGLRAGEMILRYEGISGEGNSNNQLFSVFAPSISSLSVSNDLFFLDTKIDNIPQGLRIDILPKSMQNLPNHYGADTQNSPLLNNIMFSQGSYSAGINTWNTMQEISAMIASTGSMQAMNFASLIPNSSNPAQLGIAAMIFLVAAKNGDLQSWIGDKRTEILRGEGKGSGKFERLIGRLSAESAPPTRFSSESLQGDWRHIAIPIISHQQIEKCNLYYKEDDDTQNKEGKEKKIRFIFDINFSSIGNLQIDGLLFGKRLDLILRSDDPISEASRQEIRKIYAGAINKNSLSGDIAFKSGKDNKIKLFSSEIQSGFETIVT